MVGFADLFENNDAVRMFLDPLFQDPLFPDKPLDIVGEGKLPHMENQDLAFEIASDDFGCEVFSACRWSGQGDSPFDTFEKTYPSQPFDYMVQI